MKDTQLPLLGVILCCTSIPPEKRSELAAIASQMGAVHKLDLTSDVTHLVVGDTDTPKYKFVAKERPDVQCVLPNWIEAVRASWLEGGDTNVQVLEKEHKLPTFIGLRLCVTGFDDPIYRKELEDLIIANGGEYRGNLTKDITHLVAKVPSGAKYNYAGQWGIRTVAVEWLEQSVERGMILDETLYHLSIPPSDRGRNAWVRRSISTTSLGKRTRGEEIGQSNARKLRRTASARLSSQNVGLWSELVGAPVKEEKITAGAWEEVPNKALDNGAVASEAVPESIGIAPTANNTQQTLKRSFSEGHLESHLIKPQPNTGIFHGKRLVLHGFDERKTAVIGEHLRSHGADCIHDITKLSTNAGDDVAGYYYLLVPHTMCAPETSSIVRERPPQTVVTDLWVERCLSKKRFEDPQAHVVSTPFPSFPIAGFEDLSICSTGFQGFDLLHASKAVELMGATFSQYLTTASSVLICHTICPGNEKLLYAQSWSVPAVKASWLWDSIRRGELLPFGLYLVQALAPRKISSKAVKETMKQAPPPRLERCDVKQVSISTKRPSVKTAFSPEGPRMTESKDTLRSTNVKQAEVKSPSKQPPRLSQEANSSKNPTQTPTVYQDNDTPTTLEPPPENSNSDILNTTSATIPLREITPNSSPQKPILSPAKPHSPLKPNPPPTPSPKPSSSESSLGPTISSLLAHHRSSNTNAPPSNTSDQPRPYRRRRQLFGRAPSNLSSHSHNNNNGIELSRASSVDTMNTDGLGTPLEPSNNNNKTKFPNNNNNNSGLDPMLYSASFEEDPDRVEEPLQMTQLGYEDPHVAAWRERVAIKMSGGKVSEGKVGATGKKGGGGGGKEDGKGSLGISKRTRLASSGR